MLYGAATGFVAGLLLALSVLLGAEARMATIDATLLAVILRPRRRCWTSGAAATPRRDAAPSWVAPAVFWAANGAGLLLKGPVILLVSGGTLLGLLAVERHCALDAGAAAAARRRPGAGDLLPWVVGIAGVSGGDFFARALGDNLLGKLAHGQQAHGLPAGTYLVLFVLTFWPGSLFAARALPWVWANRRRPGNTVPARLDPAGLGRVRGGRDQTAALRAADLSGDRRPGRRRHVRARRVVAPGAGRPHADRRLRRAMGGGRSGARAGRTGAAACGWGTGSMRWPRSPPWWPRSWWCTPRARRNARRRAVALACAGAAMLAITLSSSLIVLPGLQTIWLSPRIAAAVRSLRPCPDSVLASASYAEPSLVYLAGPARS